ncbi:HNH endonuclease [Comamonas terrigena]|uniref:HNH endonuclease n=1 Tax=Comamonas terrigena TaxID=32013 RepID=A0A2A7UXU4_COMTR|nr:HNH endonuclease signature motif containing protein [Comamonas terrigena]PEH90077.1 HNH endonuclease [Comamonas terrigena]BBL25368.1 HNH endonuclease [Comamonas terrigena NBRC 13299]SUY71054.1 HNH endonuclease [Comamonas terrigena]
MPSAAPRLCTQPGCRALVHDGSGRCAKHPKQAWVKKPTAAKRITGRRLQQLRQDLFDREPLCRPCSRLGLVVLATMRDHIVPLEEGGRDVEANVQPICEPCHDAKSKAERARGVRRAWGAYRDR